jgi:transcription antitermination factor NusG
MFEARSADYRANAREDSVTAQWYALSTRSRHEKQVRDRLATIGVEPLLPVTSKLSQWSDRKACIQVPLFAGYCFARFSLGERLAILQTPGVVRIVGALRPEPIPEDELAAIKAMGFSRRPTESCDYFVEGTGVEVIRGPFAGLRGQLVRKGQQDCLVIRVRLIQQAALVHIDRREVQSVLDSGVSHGPLPAEFQ